MSGKLKLFTYPYPRPAVTADIVLFAVAKDSIKVLLITRKNPPFENCLALPGGFVDEGEHTVDAAVRELNEEVCVQIDPKKLSFIGHYDEPNRDPRGWTISFAYLYCFQNVPEVKAGDDAKEAKWIDLVDLDFNQLAFDHQQIIKNALFLADQDTLRNGLLDYRAVISKIVEKTT